MAMPLLASTSGEKAVTKTYVGPPYCRAEMDVGCIACCPLVSRGVNVDGTDGRTDGPDR